MESRSKTAEIGQKNRRNFRDYISVISIQDMIVCENASPKQMIFLVLKWPHNKNEFVD
jgi:hypothetical protein